MRLLAGIGMLILAMPMVVFAQYGSEYGSPSSASAAVAQLRTAQTHAGFAAGSDAMAGVLDHLAHAVNCLEGTRGTNYNARTLNPCQGQGNGVIPDLQAESSRGQMGAGQALELAREADKVAVDGLKLTQVAQAKSAAKRVADLLGEALKAVGQ